jgi:DNA-binding NarL/FixJ family response regulator
VLITRDRLLLETWPDNRGPLAGIACVGRALDVVSGREVILQSHPQVVLLDGPTFYTEFRRLAEILSIRLRQIRTAVLVDELSETQLEVVVSFGACGLVSRQDSLPQLAEALRAVASGQTHVSERLRDRCQPDPKTGGVRLHRLHRIRDFTDRQLEVLIQLAEGKRVKDIAAALHLSEKAIESHKYRLMNLLGLHDRVELCRWAIREGLIQP